MKRSSVWFWYLVSGVSSVAFCFSWIAFCPQRTSALELRPQLNIPINNGNQGDMRDQADQLLRFGGQQEQKGHLEKAIDYWSQALELYHQVGDFEALGRTYDFLGLTYAALGQYDEAENTLRRRLGVARTRRDFQGQIYGLNNLGTVLLQREYLSAAQQSFTEALSIAQSIKDPVGEGLSLSNLGLVAAGGGDYNQAIKRYEAALTLRRRYGDVLGEANTLNNLGDAYRTLGNYREALASYRNALRLGRQALDRPAQFRAIDGLVVAYSAYGQYDNIFELLDRRLTLAQEAENLRQELRSLRLFAQVYEVTGNLAEARAFYRRAIAVTKTLGDEQQEVLLTNQLGQILYNRPTTKR